MCVFTVRCKFWHVILNFVLFLPISMYDYVDDTCGRSAPMLQSGGSTVTKSSVQLRHRVGKGILGMEECEKEKNGMGKDKALNIHTKIVSIESSKKYISSALRARGRGLCSVFTYFDILWCLYD